MEQQHKDKKTDVHVSTSTRNPLSFPASFFHCKARIMATMTIWADQVPGGGMVQNNYYGEINMHIHIPSSQSHDQRDKYSQYANHVDAIVCIVGCEGCKCT